MPCEEGKVKKAAVKKAAVKPLKEKKSEKQVSYYSDIERKGYAFSLYTVLVLDELKKELKENAQDLDWVIENVLPDLDRVLDQAFRFQIKMLIEDPGSSFSDGPDK